MLIDDFNGSEVTVKKSELLEAMKKNREAHRATFLEAQIGYREDVIKELDSMLAEARDGKKIRRSVALVEPKDHTSDYDRVILMLTDDWGWKHEFINTASNYTGRSR